MEQTPVHGKHNPDLLNVIPEYSRKLIEVGCSSGALAREYKKKNPSCQYIGMDIDPEYAKMASAHCDLTLSADIDSLPTSFFIEHKDCDTWIFGDTLEHLKDPWRVLKIIRENISKDGCVVACIPNAQHWSVIGRLCCGEFRYEDSGLLDRTHLRWFTRKTIINLFESTGYKITVGAPRIFHESDRDRFLPIISEMAEMWGYSPEEAALDASALQYVVRAVPA